MAVFLELAEQRLARSNVAVGGGADEVVVADLCRVKDVLEALGNFGN